KAGQRSVRAGRRGVARCEHNAPMRRGENWVRLAFGHGQRWPDYRRAINRHSASALDGKAISFKSTSAASSQRKLSTPSSAVVSIVDDTLATKKRSSTG